MFVDGGTITKLKKSILKSFPEIKNRVKANELAHKIRYKSMDAKDIRDRYSVKQEVIHAQFRQNGNDMEVELRRLVNQRLKEAGLNYEEGEHGILEEINETSQTDAS